MKFSAIPIVILLTLSLPSFSEDVLVVQQPADIDIGFAQLLQDPNTMFPEEMLEIDPNVKRVALYHREDRLHKRIEKKTQTFIEGQIMSRLLNAKRFEIVDCVECSLITVKLGGENVKVSQAVEDNQQLRKLGRTLLVDGFFMWSANQTGDSFSIDIRLVRASDNTIIWNRQYARTTKKEEQIRDFKKVNWEIYTSAWGLGSSREGPSAQSFPITTTFGLRRRETSSIHPHISYGLGIEAFGNVANRTYFNLTGVDFYGRVLVDIHALKKYVPTKMYVDAGQSFYNQHQSLIFKYGLEFPFSSNGYLDVGVVYLFSNDIIWPSQTGFEQTSEYGGAGYDFTIGYRF